MASTRIVSAFRRMKEEGRTGLILYVTVGFPDVETIMQLVPALSEAGADMIELGVPFSDPLADGPTVQKASFHALQQGVTPQQCIEVVAALRGRGVDIPIAFMGYYNPILSAGVAEFTRRAREAGVDGLIVPDLPPEESGPLREASEKRGLDLIPLVSPTSTDRRLAAACQVASGFIYCVSIAGVTGAREEVSQTGADLVQRVRRHTGLPVAIGFGISRREHFEAVGRFADAAIIGSALVNVIGQAQPGNAVPDAVQFVAEILGRQAPVARGVS